MGLGLLTAWHRLPRGSALSSPGGRCQALMTASEVSAIARVCWSKMSLREGCVRVESWAECLAGTSLENSDTCLTCGAPSVSREQMSPAASSPGPRRDPAPLRPVCAPLSRLTEATGLIPQNPCPRVPSWDPAGLCCPQTSSPCLRLCVLSWCRSASLPHPCVLVQSRGRVPPSK